MAHVMHPFVAMSIDWNKDFDAGRAHIKEQPETFDRFNAQWTPTIVIADGKGTAGNLDNAEKRYRESVHGAIHRQRLGKEIERLALLITAPNTRDSSPDTPARRAGSPAR